MGKPFTECTIEELHGKAKTLKTVLSVLLILMVLYASYMVYKIVAGEELNVGLLVPPIGVMFAGMTPVMIGLGNIKKELKSRDTDEN